MDITVGDALHPAILKESDLKHEWEQLKDELDARGLVGGNVQDDDDKIAALLTDSSILQRFPNVSFLYSVKRVLWLDTAECERGFSIRTRNGQQVA
jgi:hypothetical protein